MPDEHVSSRPSRETPGDERDERAPSATADAEPSAEPSHDRPTNSRLRIGGTPRRLRTQVAAVDLRGPEQGAVPAGESVVQSPHPAGGILFRGGALLRGLHADHQRGGALRRPELAGGEPGGDGADMDLVWPAAHLRRAVRAATAPVRLATHHPGDALDAGTGRVHLHLLRSAERYRRDGGVQRHHHPDDAGHLLHLAAGVAGGVLLPGQPRRVRGVCGAGRGAKRSERLVEHVLRLDVAGHGGVVHSDGASRRGHYARHRHLCGGGSVARAAGRVDCVRVVSHLLRTEPRQVRGVPPQTAGRALFRPAHVRHLPRAVHCGHHRRGHLLTGRGDAAGERQEHHLHRCQPVGGRFLHHGAQLVGVVALRASAGHSGRLDHALDAGGAAAVPLASPSSPPASGPGSARRRCQCRRGRRGIG
eukprot:ctg_639.g270